MNSRSRHRLAHPLLSSLARLSLALALAVLSMMSLMPAQPVAAQISPFSNPSFITIPDSGNAAPYPSSIGVGGLSGTVTRVEVSLFGVSHRFIRDVDVLLVGPTGQGVVLMSDVGGDVVVDGIDLTFDDTAGPLPPPTGFPVASGTYRPTNHDDGGSDTWSAPAPAGPYASALSAFNGLNPNGAWQLFVVDDLGGGVGVIASGWSLTIDTMSVQFSASAYSVGENDGTATITVTRTQGSSGAVSVNYAAGGGSATPGADYGAVNGTLNWGSGDSSPRFIQVPIVDDTAVEGNETIGLSLSAPSGGAALGIPNTATLTIVENDVGFRFSAATYSAPESGGGAVISVLRVGGANGAVCVDFATSNGTASAPADYATTNGQLCWADGDTTPKFFVVPLVSDGLSESNETVNLTLSNPTGGAQLLAPSTAVLTIQDFANTGAISIPTLGAATPYPSTIAVAGLAGSVTRVAVHLYDLSHTFPDDVDVLLVGPTGQTVMLMSDAGGNPDLNNVDLTFQDGAGALPDNGSISAGTYAPTDYEVGDIMPGPAPAGPYGTLLSSFNGLNPNGTWQLFVADDTGPDGGSIAGGWSLEIDTPGSVQFSAASFGAGENSGTATISATRIGGSKGVVCADYASSDGTAGAPADYTATSGQLCWANGNIAPKTFTVPIVNDTLAESAESLNLTLSNPTGGAVIGSPNPATLTILDDEVAGALQFSAPEYSVDEDGGTATITVERVGGADGAVCANYATSDGTANAGVHYGTVTGSVCWADGDSTPKTFTVPIIDNTAVEVPNKTVNLALSSPTSPATLGVPNTAVLTIVENDVGLAFSAPLFRVGETEGAATITLRRIGGSGGNVCVNFATSNGTAGAPADYAATSDQLCWGDGDTVDKSITIPIVNDDLTEGDETVNLALSSPTGGAQIIAPSTASLVILDLGNTGNIRINSVGNAAPYPSSINVAGVQGSVTKVTVNLYSLSHTFPDDIDILLVGPTGQTLLLMSDAGGAADINDVDLTFADGAPALPDNSLIASGTYQPTNFGSGDTFSSPAPAGPYGANLSAFNNLDPNGTWNLFVVDDLGLDAGAIAGGWSLTIDTPGGLQFSSATYSGNEAAGAAMITVKRVGGHTGAVSVQYATSNGTATAPADYNTTSGTLNWSAGDINPKTLNVAIVDDLLIEGPETINLALSGATGGAVAGSPALLTIVDNEGPVSFAFSSASYQVDENGGTATIAVQRSGDSTNAFDVTYSSSNGSASSGADYGAVSGTLHWNAGDTADKTFTVPILDDTAIETDETVNLTLGGATSGATVGGPATLTIVENDVGLRLCAPDYRAAETAGSASVAVCRAGSSAGAVSVQYASADGTAKAPADYAAASGTLSWADGDSTPKSFSIPVVADALVEGDETVNVSISNPVGGAIVDSPSSAVLTIVDFASTGEIAIPSSGNATPYPSQIAVSGLVGSVSRVSVRLYGLTHSFPDDLDILLVGPAGQTVLLMSDVGDGNSIGDVDLTFADTGATLPDSGTIVSGSYKPTNVGAGDTFGAPAPGGAYGGTLSVFNGQNPNGTWSLFVVDDSPSGGAGSIAGGWSLTIDTPGGLRVVESAPTVGEAAGSATVSVSRVGGSVGMISAQYATSNGTATAPADYNAASGTLSWADGDIAPKTFNITINDDLLIDPGEDIHLALSGPTGGAALSSPSAVDLTIVDNDSPGALQFSAGTYSVNETAGTISIPVQRVDGSGGVVSVVCATGGGSATPGSDYTATSDTLSWAAGDTGDKLCVIPIANDDLNEGNETVNLSLSSPTGGATLGNPNVAALTIVDNAPGLLQFSSLSYSARENDGEATITVRRVGGSSGAISVDYATADGSASAASDYSATSGRLSWAAGDTSDKTFTIPITNDGALESNETIALSLSNPIGGAALGSPSTAVLNILDNDSIPVIQFSTATYTVSESAGFVTIVVSRLFGEDGAIAVDYDTANNTAGVNDYGTTSGTLTWAAGDTSDKTFTVAIKPDSLIEGNEAFSVLLSNPTGGAVLGRQSALVVILDDEPGVLTPPQIFIPIIVR
jgi:subtilisin-like proprotein convertase family protein